MLELINLSNYQTYLLPAFNDDESFQLVVKQTYRFDLNSVLFPAHQLNNIYLQDVYHDDPKHSSLKYLSDMQCPITNSELLLLGKLKLAKKVSSIRVNLTLISAQRKKLIDKTLCIYGPRFWRKKLLTLKISEPLDINELELKYEHAYGGVDQNDQESYQYNPVGMSFYNSSSPGEENSLPLIEYPNQLIRHPYQRVRPACFNSISRHWRRHRDNDSSLTHQVAHGRAFLNREYSYTPFDQCFYGCFNGGETIILNHFYVNKSHLELILPRLSSVGYLLRRNKKELLYVKYRKLRIDIDKNTIDILGYCRITWTKYEHEVGRVVFNEK